MTRPSATRHSAEFNVILTSPKPASNGQRHEILPSPIGWERSRVKVSFSTSSLLLALNLWEVQEIRRANNSRIQALWAQSKTVLPPLVLSSGLNPNERNSSIIFRCADTATAAPLPPRPVF